MRFIPDPGEAPAEPRYASRTVVSSGREAGELAARLSREHEERQPKKTETEEQRTEEDGE